MAMYTAISQQVGEQ